MVEHAQIIDTDLLHEPKGITDSVSGEVYISDNDDENTNPTGHWGKLPISSLNVTPPQTATQTYSSVPAAVTLSNTIVKTPTGTLSTATDFSDVNQNTVELYKAVDNLLSRLTVVESNLSKVQTLLTSLDSGLKTAGYVEEDS